MTTWDRRGTDDIGSPGIFFVFEKVENNQSHVDLSLIFTHSWFGRRIQAQPTTDFGKLLFGWHPMNISCKIHVQIAANSAFSELPI